jgi:hypothetical protein
MRQMTRKLTLAFAIVAACLSYRADGQTTTTVKRDKPIDGVLTLTKNASPSPIQRGFRVHQGELPPAAGYPIRRGSPEKRLSVGETQSKRLAKVEELTLRLIQAEERNSRLEQRLATLEHTEQTIPARQEKARQQARERSGNE